MLWLSIMFWIMYLLITKAGMIFVDAEILREGNEQLLNNFDQGILIFAEGTSELIFANEAV